MKDNLLHTGSYFITSSWGTLFALGLGLVGCYLLFVLVRFLIKRIYERNLRRTLKQNYQRELDRVRAQTNPDDRQAS